MQWFAGQARKHGGPAEAFQRAVQAQQTLDAAKVAAREANIAHTRAHKAQWQELILAAAGLSRRALINFVLAIDEVGKTSPAELEGMSTDDLRVLFARVLVQRSGP